MPRVTLRALISGILVAVSAVACGSSNVSGPDPAGEQSGENQSQDVPDDPGDPGGEDDSRAEDAPGGEKDTRDPTRRSITNGDVVGFEDGEVYAFYGVPYAAAPVEDLRWRPPVKAEWTGEWDATVPGAPCPQLHEDGTRFGQEDCLNLNVWTPTAPGAEPLPVFVFIHGGGNLAGSNTEPYSRLINTDVEGWIYDGAGLAEVGNMVVVVTNYRLGPLGYLSHPALDGEHTANWGHLDILLALQWVQDNIAAFGGDPSRVVLAGQSGGGRNTVTLDKSPLSDGLFSAIAVHSAPLGLAECDEIRGRSAELVTEVGCAGAPDIRACLEQVAVDEMLFAEANTPLGLANGAFLPCIDGRVHLGQPRDVIISGEHAKRPMLIGSTGLEYAHRWDHLTEQNYALNVSLQVGPFTGAVLEQYPVERFAFANEAYATMMSDKNVTCAVRRFARLAVDNGVAVHFYRFNRELPVEAQQGVVFGAYHTTDILYLFQPFDDEPFAATEGDFSTAQTMARYWGRFAAGEMLDAEANGDPAWPAFMVDEGATLLLDAESRIAYDIKADDCDFWDGLFGL